MRIFRPPNPLFLKDLPNYRSTELPAAPIFNILATHQPTNDPTYQLTYMPASHPIFNLPIQKDSGLSIAHIDLCPIGIWGLPFCPPYEFCNFTLAHSARLLAPPLTVRGDSRPCLLTFLYRPALPVLPLYHFLISSIFRPVV